MNFGDATWYMTASNTTNNNKKHKLESNQKACNTWEKNEKKFNSSHYFWSSLSLELGMCLCLPIKSYQKDWFMWVIAVWRRIDTLWLPCRSALATVMWWGENMMKLFNFILFGKKFCCHCTIFLSPLTRLRDVLLYFNLRKTLHEMMKWWRCSRQTDELIHSLEFLNLYCSWILLEWINK